MTRRTSTRKILRSLSKAQLLECLEGELALIEHERRSAHYAEQLMAQLHIRPHGVDLVCFLDAGSSNRNVDALRFWVAEKLDDDDIRYEATLSSMIDVLLNHLSRQLTRMEAANS